MTRTVLLYATVALLPLLVPEGPAHTAPVDAFAMLFVAVTVVALAHRREPVRAPAALALLAILVPTVVATTVSLSPGQSLTSFVIEVYLVLLMWLAATTMANRAAAFRAVLVTWAVAATGWAILMLATHYALLPPQLLDLIVTQSTSARVSGTARNPNLAASYLMTSVFVLLVAPLPFRWITRWLLSSVVLWALIVTESNGAILAVALGLLVVAATVPMRALGGPNRVGVAAAGVLVAALALGATLVTVGIPSVGVGSIDQFVQTAQSDETSGPLSGNTSRLDTSVSARVAIWSAAWSGGLRSAALGAGPGAGREIPVNGSTLDKELHNDYLAFLLERGVFGLAALLFFLAVLLWWCIPLLMSSTGAFRWSFAPLAGAVLANMVMATTHESFHFRHFWLLIAVVWTARHLVTREPEHRRGTPGTVSTDTKEPANALV